MMLVGSRLRVILVTTHLALARVPAALSTERIEKTILMTAAHLTRFHGLTCPRLAVAGLNPHAGEAGAFGDEEERIIAPAVRRLQGQRYSLIVAGPFPADTVFVRAVKGEFDGVICLYHDQGLIPLKLLSWEDGVNVTIGLPIVRTSPDHGTAFDIAGQGKADPRSMQAAIALATEMTQHRSPHESSHLS
jgi:4-hydroxythreonine-4-phosphate dehydrogenase